MKDGISDIFGFHKCKMGTKVVHEFLRRTFGWLPARIALALMAWLGFINLYMTRINLSVILVAMVKRNTSSGHLAPCLEIQDVSLESTSPTSNSTSQLQETAGILETEQEDVFEWDPTTQGLVLGSFFYGYAMTQVIGGRLAENYGSKWLFGITVTAGGFCALLSPLCARVHYSLFIALRIFQGAVQGGSWPAMHACITRWIPPLERPRFIGTVYFGNTLSTAITLPLCGLIIDAHGWPAAFYITGSLSIIWGLLWFNFMYNSPNEHPRISQKELEYIETTVRESGTTANRTQSGAVPWRAIFTSPPMLALILGDIGNKWGITLFYAQLPTYMSNILGFSIKSNGALSALPFASRYIGSILMSTLADWLLSRKYLSIRTTRRIFSTICMWGPALMLIGVAYAGCNWKAIVAMFCVGLFMNGAITASILVNHTDISPNYSGTLFGICNQISTLVTFVVPVITGVLTEGQQTVAQWQKVFWICVPMYTVTQVIFFIFCSGSVQPWNYCTEAKVDAEESRHQRETMPLNTGNKVQ
ncbi:sialin-like isoform X1 [Macrobrachium nipponense]|uniref:sialin-like isoform X1 n=2 Tax=Macrobrachium nipponense TaxID=159736 RepID=UPI0030C7D6FA